MKDSALSRESFVILCDGNFPTRKDALKLLSRSTVIACDGAYLNLKKNGLDAEYIVGDMDTLSPSMQKKLRSKIHKESEQDYNDQTKAFRFTLKLIEKAVSEGKKEFEITILGATGKREDHALGNISYLPQYAEVLREKFPDEKISLCMVSDYGVFIPVLNTVYLKGEKGDRISIFSFDNTLKIKSEGLKYKTDDVTFDLWWKATLNTFSSATVKLIFNHPAKALLYFPF